jgi:hypothetical protein
MIPAENGILPVIYNPMYLQGYTDGYKQAKLEMQTALDKLEALKTETGTVDLEKGE